jgi:hypothetical protein
MQAFQHLFNSLAHVGVLSTTHPNFRAGGRAGPLPLASQLELNKN